MTSTFSTDMPVKEELSLVTDFCIIAPFYIFYGQGSQIFYFQYFIAIFQNGCPPTCQIENISNPSN